MQAMMEPFKRGKCRPTFAVNSTPACLEPTSELSVYGLIISSMTGWKRRRTHHQNPLRSPADLSSFVFRTEPYSQDDCKWKYNSCKGPGMPESWQRFLMGIGGPDSVDDCRIIGNDCVYFIDSTLCNLYPEAHFALWATSRFATYLNSLYINLGAVRDFLDGDYGDIQTSFYTPKTPPSKLTLPLNILAGIMSAITAIAPLFGPAALAAIPAGVATILNGILVLDELRTPE